MCYIVSFGNSDKYRLPFIESDDRDIKLVREDVESYLKGRFPQFAGLKFLEKMNLEKTTDTSARALPEFNADALNHIKDVLKIEVEDAESLEILDSNAPYAEINRDAI